ncbi:MAG: T9SS type A sorting domain-containing protein [Bacteroidia bacterium]|nr:T9SS type A sorting domain-containing protein [Bacteroidia bacterium]
MSLRITKVVLSFFIAIAYLITAPAFAQLVLNNGGVVKLNGGTSGTPIYFVLNTPPATPIKTIVTAGTPTNGIVLESEYNILQYNLATATTSITVPYLSNTLEQLPLTITPTSAGVGAGNIKFSSTVAAIRATGYDNTAYLPTGVLNMGSNAITNNSDKTIDRFWIIDATGYTTKPAVTLDFTYLDDELAINGTGTFNSIAEANLQAQRYNPNTSDWEGFSTFLPAGTTNTVTNTVSGVTVTPANFFRAWTLNDNSKPLPIELISFEANCVNKETVLQWCTATETNNHYFTLTQSVDGINFTTIDKINGNGTTSQKHCYQYALDVQQDAITYYELWQTDFDNTTKKLKLIAAQPCNGKTDQITITNNGTKNVTLFVNSLIESNDNVIIHNTLGQVMLNQPIGTQQGNNQFNLNLNTICNGVYYVTIIRNNQPLTSKKIIITDN